MQRVKEDKVIDEEGYMIDDAQDVVICIRWPNGHLDDFAFKDYGVATVYAELIIESDPKFDEYKNIHMSTHADPNDRHEYWTPNCSYEYYIMQPEDYLTVKPEETFILEDKGIRVGDLMGTCIALRDGLGIQPIFEDLGGGRFKVLETQPEPWFDED